MTLRLPLRRSNQLLLLCCISLLFQLLAACQPPPRQQIDVNVSEVDRPSQDLAEAVERYLREFQPGPLPRLFQTTYLYDRNGVMLAELWNEGKRTWKPLSQISSNLITATVSTEDSSFFTNFGVDPFRLAAAILQNVQEGDIVSGASTITMQLARNLFVGPEQRYDRSFDRKLLEIGLAQELTNLYSKAELLEMYLNLLNYGNLAYGPEAAAQLYFGKPAAALDMAEASFLAGIPQRPLNFDPFRNFQNVKERQRVVLDLMVAHLDLTQEEADRVYSQPITVTQPITAPATILAPHFVQYTELVLDRRLGESGYTRRSGFHIYTTLDLHTQAVAQKVVSEQIAQFRPRYNLGNAALVAIQPGSGDVLAFLGSANFYDESIAGQVNVAIHRRQPGSTLKPILFALAMNDNLLSPATVMWDTPVNYDQGNGSFYRPLNYDNLYHGLVSARTALANSYNVPAVKLLDGMGIGPALKGFERFGLRSLLRDSYHGLGMALGANEVTLMELTNAYSVLANGGLYMQPEVVLQALDSQGNPADLPPRPDSVQVISPAAAFQVTDILSDNDARRPMFGANSPMRLSRPAAAKTGTTSDFRDNWTVGYTRYLITGVWSGNSNGQPMRNSTGVTGAAPIWNIFMERALKDPEILKLLGIPDNDPQSWEFSVPPDVERRAECPPNLYCRAGGDYFSKEWLARAGEDGALADSFIRRKSLSIFTGKPDDHWVKAYCEHPNGKERLMLKLGGSFGLEAPGQVALAAQPNAVTAPTGSSSTPATTLPTVQPSGQTTVTLQSAAGKAQVATVNLQDAKRVFSVSYYPEREVERFNAIAWSIYRGIAIDVGPCDSLAYHVVQPGEYWGIIANRFGLSAGALQAVNQALMRDQSILLSGDRLIVPKGIPIQVGLNGSAYAVQPGDTWSNIATTQRVPLKLLIAVNPDIVRPYFILKPGDEVWVPDQIEVAKVLNPQ